MIALVIIIGILTVVALLRFGVSVEYSANGFTAAIQVGPLSLSVFPRKEKTVSVKKEAKNKARKEEKARKKAEKKALKKTEEKKPGALKTVLDILPAIRKMLKRLRHRLLIKRLVIHYTVAGEDPSKTALTFGATNAVIGIIVPVLEDNFRIRRRDIRAFFDFFDSKQKIYINAAISLSIWEAIYIVFAILPAVLKIIKSSKVTIDRKDGQDNGKDPSK